MRTVGVEEELLLVNLRDGRTEPAAQRVLARAAELAASYGATGPATAASGAALSDAGGGLTAEFMQDQVELHTAPVRDLTAMRRELCHWRDRAAEAAGDLGCAVAALGTSPVHSWPVATESARYRIMHEGFGLLARQQLTCGCHVHVGVSSDEEGVAVLDRIRVWLPVLTALSANSPYWSGQDSGFASYRSLVMSRWPAAGPLGCLGSAAAYHRLVASLVDSGVLLDRGMVYFDARLSHRFPTVEIRVADVCLDVGDTVLVAALARGLVDTAAAEWRRGMPPPTMPNELLRLASWQAAHDGLGGRLLHPDTARPAPAADVVDLLVCHLGAALEESGDLPLVRGAVGELLTRGTGAVVQRRVLAATGDAGNVVRHAARVTVRGQGVTGAAARGIGGDSGG